MATKTITITEEAYHLLAGKRLEGESFSEELTRILLKTRAKTLHDFFGILSDEEAKAMRTDLHKLKALNVNMLREKLKHETS